MAAVRKIIQANKNKTLSPSLCAFRRGIAYKLFVGGMHSPFLFRRRNHSMFCSSSGQN